MRFRQFRDKARWVALAGALLIVVGQWVMHVEYLDREVWVDRTPRSFTLIGLVLTIVTFLLGFVTLPRWQSFIALLAVLWVAFISIQGV